MVCFLHTADWQIGKPFAGIEDDHKRILVQQERLAVLTRIAEAARQHQAEFILVAGDLFDSPTPTQAMVSAACAAIGKLGVPVYAIPGNHDHGGPGALWGQPFFQQEQAGLAPNLHVLTKAEPIECAGAVIFPCPLLRRAEPGDTSAWLREPGVFERAGDKVRLVLAHGSVQGFGSESDDDELPTATNQIDLSRLDPSAFDYIALGDWHGTKSVAPSAWYAGTPETDRFPKGLDNRPGHILAVSVGRAAPAQVTEISTARLGWHSLTRDLAEDAAIAQLRADLDALLGARAQEDLLRLELSGTLGIAATTELETLLFTLSARLLRLKLINRTGLAPTEAEVEALTQRAGDPLIASVARQLVAKAVAGEDVAQMALRELHARCLGR